MLLMNHSYEGSLTFVGLPFLYLEAKMFDNHIPSFCRPCIQRAQAQCPHLHISTYGGFHYSEGEVWDDLVEVCDDCGANLNELPGNLLLADNLEYDDSPF